MKSGEGAPYDTTQWEAANGEDLAYFDNDETNKEYLHLPASRLVPFAPNVDVTLLTYLLPTAAFLRSDLNSNSTETTIAMNANNIDPAPVVNASLGPQWLGSHPYPSSPIDFRHSSLCPISHNLHIPTLLLLATH